MKYVIASDSFKGSCSTLEVAQVAREAILAHDAQAEVIGIGIADGGEGTMETLTRALNGEFIQVQAHDAIMRPVLSRYGYLPQNDLVIIDMAETGGITRLSKSELDPLHATTFGLGEQIADAVARGYKNFLIGLGGSATCDAGKGMMKAIAEANIDISDCHFTALCDVSNPLYGPNGSAYVFAPQKGASPEQVIVLDNQLKKVAEEFPNEALMPGAGAAGGLGFAVVAYLKGNLKPGIETILQAQNFDNIIDGADLIITGEGKMDRQTLMNKAPMGVLNHAKAKNIKCVAIAGKVENREELIEAGFADVCEINPPHTPLSMAMQPDFAKAQIYKTISHILRNNS